MLLTAKFNDTVSIKSGKNAATDSNVRNHATNDGKAKTDNDKSDLYEKSDVGASSTKTPAYILDES